MLQVCLAQKEALSPGPCSRPTFLRWSWHGRGGLVMSKVPLYPPRLERAPRPLLVEWLHAMTSRQCPVVTRRRVRRATCPPSPRRLPRRSPLSRVQGVGFHNRPINTPAALHAILNRNPFPGLGTRVHRNQGYTPPLGRSGASGTTGVPCS